MCVCGDVTGTQSGFDVEAGDRRGEIISFLHLKQNVCVVDRVREVECMHVCASM